MVAALIPFNVSDAIPRWATENHSPVNLPLCGASAHLALKASNLAVLVRSQEPVERSKLSRVTVMPFSSYISS